MSKSITCIRCNTYVDERDYFFPCNMCDDCFDKMMEEETNDFDILYGQNRMCAVCNNPINSAIEIADGKIGVNKRGSTWTVINGKAIHWNCR